MFYINVVGQAMYATSANDHLVEGSQEFVKFCFQLSDDWNGLTVFAQFRQGEEAYNKYLDSENTANLPAEIKEGTCTLMLYGSNDTVIGTSNYLTFRVDKNMLVSNTGSTEISKSLYDQLVSRVAGLDTRIDQIEEGGVSTERLSEIISEEVAKYLESGKPVGSGEGAVVFNETQSLTASQRNTARENIGIYTGVAMPSSPQDGDILVDPESGAVVSATAYRNALWNYGGAVIPKLNYAQGQYEHVVIFKTSGAYRAACSESPWSVTEQTTSTDGTAETKTVVSGTALCYDLEDGQWVSKGVQDFSASISDASWAWTATAIQGSDGTLYLDACSDPTPMRTARNVYIIDAATAASVTEFDFLKEYDVVLVAVDSQTDAAMI